MIWLFAAFLSAIIFGLGSFLLTLGSHKNYPESIMLLGLYIAGSIIFLGTLLSHHDISFDRYILFFSILVGLGSYYGNSFLVKAFDLGPACLAAPLMNISVLLVILLSCYIYHENIANYQYVGIGCIVAGASLLGCNFKNTIIKSKFWIVFVILAIIAIFMREGGLKIAFEAGVNNFSVLFYGYAFATGLAILTFYKQQYISPTLTATSIPQVTTKKTQAFVLGSLVGICSSIGLGLLAYAITCGPASVIIPIFSARSIVTVLLIVFFLKEKLFLFQWIAISFIIAGTFFIT